MENMNGNDSGKNGDENDANVDNVDDQRQKQHDQQNEDQAQPTLLTDHSTTATATPTADENDDTDVFIDHAINYDFETFDDDGEEEKTEMTRSDDMHDKLKKMYDSNMSTNRFRPTTTKVEVKN